MQNPLPGFSAVAKNHKLGNVRPNTEFFDAAADGTLPPVSWVMPTSGRGEHPPDYIGNGQAWVTKLVNAVMQGPEEQWLHTAIFITWDDWGGFYDHVKPIRIDENGYGIRVPGMHDQPVVAAERIDSQTLSFDAYLKLDRGPVPWIRAASTAGTGVGVTTAQPPARMRCPAPWPRSSTSRRCPSHR